MKQKLAEFINVIFGLRKFILILLVCVIAVIFRIKGLIDGAEMVDLLKTTTICFLGASGVDHIVSSVRNHYSSKEGGEYGDDPNTPYEDLITRSAQELEDLKEESKNG